MLAGEFHERFRRLCDASQSFVLTTHVNPDGDALGSEISLARFLLDRGKEVHLVNQDPTPEPLGFLERDEHRIELYDPDRHDALLQSSDLVILVDNSAPDRLGRMERGMLGIRGHTLCIDHHPSRTPPWAHLVLDEGYCATAVMVYELGRGAGWTPDLLAAEAIFTGLATDTGFFRFNSTNATGYEVAAELVRLGVRPARIYREVYERNSLPYTRLLGHALADVRVDAESIASVVLRRDLIDRLGAEDEETAEILTALLAMDRIRIALLFRELSDGRVKVSLRSKGPIDVHSLAAEFGGGGHRNASGIVMSSSLEQATREVIGRASAALGP
jgi:phosphoesterase RecJ-like protein